VNPIIYAAIEHLAARPHGDENWKYRDEGTGRWYAATLAELHELGAMLLAEVPDAYSHWCANHAGVEL
jgi:hypothetical protein